MPRPVDDPEHDRVLPNSELNPMVNPLLSQHMGRWAEVYFTSPPEKRDEAVLELLRELENEGMSETQFPAHESAGTEPRTVESQNEDFDKGVEDRAEPLSRQLSASKFYDPSAPSWVGGRLVECEACGERNLAEQRFCGMCGIPLVSRTDASRSETSRMEVPQAKVPQTELPVTESSRTVVAMPQAAAADPVFESPGNDETSGIGETTGHGEAVPEFADDFEIHNFLAAHRFAPEPAIEDESPRPAEPGPEPGPFLPGPFLPAPFLPEMQSGRGASDPAEFFAADPAQSFSVHTDGHFADEPIPALHEGLDRPNGVEPGTHSVHPNRYRAYVGAVAAFLLCVVIYMAWRVMPARSAVSGTPPPAATAAKTRVERNPSPPPAAEANDMRNDQGDEASTNPASEAHPAPAAGAQIAHSAALLEKLPASAKEQAPQSGGGEELATAESYLNGTQGRQRDTGEAAQWLWKAVSKENAEATLLLSDLYAAGDGVAKNCDQARILLDAAARKNVPGADERRRQLQAGCR